MKGYVGILALSLLVGCKSTPQPRHYLGTSFEERQERTEILRDIIREDFKGNRQYKEDQELWVRDKLVKVGNNEYLVRFWEEEKGKHHYLQAKKLKGKKVIDTQLYVDLYSDNRLDSIILNDGREIHRESGNPKTRIVLELQQEKFYNFLDAIGEDGYKTVEEF